MHGQGERRRLVVGISGASGAIYGIRLLQAAGEIPELELDLIITPAARLTIEAETDWSADGVAALADRVYADDDLAAPIASGSVPTVGMVVAPCSIKTLSAIAHSYAATLLARAADVHLKERRPLLLAVRETPLHLGHLRLMMQVAELGGIIYPPVPAFYSRPQSVSDIVDFTVGRMLARLGFPNALYKPWAGPAGEASEA
jgi:4-hydroxy-3-polyprenylbenzoate decarboxylase